jgi:hypothetical protein
MNEPTFKPSQVFLNAVPPLVGTMGKTEAEVAAALLVRACHVRGDAWAPVRAEEMGRVLSADLEAKTEPWASLDRNPFCKPNFDILVERGFAEFSDGRRVLALTEKGIEALRRWVDAA